MPALRVDGNRCNALDILAHNANRNFDILFAIADGTLNIDFIGLFVSQD